MKTTYLNEIDSTQKYLKKMLLDNHIVLPHAVVAQMQHNGIGSRDNVWKGMEGNLFLSFAISIDDLPKDLKLESSSIYFSYLLKDVLHDLNSHVWLKWPNDFYIRDKKIGGMITNIVNNTLICGLGLNLKNSPKNFGVLDIQISKELLLDKYFNIIKKSFSWKQVFSKYKLEFDKSKSFFTHENNSKISLTGAILQSDGSIIVDNKRIYSLR